MDDTKIRRGTLPWSERTEWLYPTADIGTIDWPFTYGSIDVDEALASMQSSLRGTRTCVQAGGCIGIWPLRLALAFDRVITFEPEPVNYQCLQHNVADADNIETWNAALGADNQARVHMGLEANYVGHCGAWQVMPGGSTETLCIDDLLLDDVDLIYLDIEGSEYNALAGAAETIERCRPVIGMESTGLNRRYNNGASPVELLKREHGYRLLVHVNRKDVLMVPDG